MTKTIHLESLDLMQNIIKKRELKCRFLAGQLDQSHGSNLSFEVNMRVFEVNLMNSLMRLDHTSFTSMNATLFQPKMYLWSCFQNKPEYMVPNCPETKFEVLKEIIAPQFANLSFSNRWILGLVKFSLHQLLVVK